MPRTSLSESIISYLLLEKGVTTATLVEHFKKQKYTKQGVYKALRALRKEGKILWIKTKIEMNFLFLHKEIERLAKALPRKEIIFQEFNEGRKVYYAKTLTELEHVYGQIFISLVSSLNKSVKDFLFYDVHNYTYVNTVSIVDWYIDFIVKHGGNIYLLVGSTSTLDLVLKKKNKMKSIQIHCTKSIWKVNVSVFGDYVITVKTDKKILEKMEKIFEMKDEKDARTPLSDLYEEKSRHKIVVEKNEEKARIIEKEFKKYFHLKGLK